MRRIIKHVITQSSDIEDIRSEDLLTIQNISSVLRDSSRFQSLPTGCEALSGLVGNSHVSGRVIESCEDKRILDALASAYRFDAGVSLVLAVADGFGGHHDIYEDCDIAMISRQAVNAAVESLAQCDIVDQSKNDYLRIVANISADIDITRGQSSTLACCRVFSDPSSSTGLSIRGFSVGDCIVFYYDPEAKKINTVLPGQRSVFGPATITSYREDDVVYLAEEIPQGVILFVCSDGVHEHLLRTEAVREGVEQLFIDEEKILPLFTDLSIASNLASYENKIIESVIAAVEKSLAAEPAKAVGDDLSLLTAMVSAEAFQEAHRQYVIEPLVKEIDSLIANGWLASCLQSRKERNALLNTRQQLDATSDIRKGFGLADALNAQGVFSRKTSQRLQQLKSSVGLSR